MKRGRPRGGRLGKALQETVKATESLGNLEVIMDEMSDKQRRLYVSLARGRNALEAAIESGHRAWFEGISKRVTLKDGHELFTKSVSLNNLDQLDEASYAKLLRYCESQLKKDHPYDEYENHIAKINDFFALIAPDVARGLSNMFFDEKIPPAVKSKIGFGLLDRAGYKDQTELPPGQNVVVNIIAPQETVHATIVKPEGA